MLVVLLIAVPFVIFIAIMAKQRREERIKALTEWAVGRDWTYAAEGDDSLLRDGDPFTSRGTVEHVVTGEHRNRSFTAFEYSYTTTSTSGNPPTTSTTRHAFTVVAVPAPGITATVQITNEHFGHKLLGLVGVQDLQIGHEEFDAQFRIKTSDDDSARALLQPDLANWLLADPRTDMLPFRFAQGEVLTWTSGELRPGEALRLLDFLADVLDQTRTGLQQDT